MSVCIDSQNHEYLWISCKKCQERVKLAKNRGTPNWCCMEETGIWVEEFLREHGDCEIDLEVTE